MHRTILIVLAVIGLLVQESSGCDVCSGFVNSGGIGLVANYQNNLVGTRWSATSFRSNTDHEANIQDHFSALDVFFQYRLNTKLRLTFFQLYKWNSRTEVDGSINTVDGLTDSRIWAHYIAIDRPLGEVSNLFWDIGLGLKFPFGKYDPDIHERNLPENFNISNGSWGYLFQTNVVYIFNNWGLSSTTMAQLNSTSTSGYQFGHQLSTAALLFYRITAGQQLQVVPYAGWYFENVTTDRYANGKDVPGTGGNGHYAQAGLQLNFDNWQVGGSYAEPLTQSYSDAEIIAQGRYSIELTYSF